VSEHLARLQQDSEAHLPHRLGGAAGDRIQHEQVERRTGDTAALER